MSWFLFAHSSCSFAFTIALSFWDFDGKVQYGLEAISDIVTWGFMALDAVGLQGWWHRLVLLRICQKLCISQGYAHFCLVLKLLRWWP